MVGLAVGIGELGVLLTLVVALALLQRLGVLQMFWLLGLVPCFALGMFITPADPLSMLIVGGASAATFIAGVHCSRYVRPANGTS